ncbi:MAG: sulfurtransferase [Parvularculaceae bacterium]|nr:sulfurtransferase [Parvularculaceae bacterium]
MTSLITADELKKLYTDKRLAVIDATWFLGDAKGIDAFNEGHLPGTRFFDIDAVSDKTSDLPHMLPSPEQFQAALRTMVEPEAETIVVYDSSPLKSATRLWWSLKAMGIDNVRVLDGGLAAWHSAGGEVSTDVPAPTTGDLTTTFQPHCIVGYDELNSLLDDPKVLVLDARPEGRFTGRDPEPRPGLPSGAMPGAGNVPFGKLYTEGGKLRSRLELTALFEPFQLSERERIVTSCGSGVTACSILLALEALGFDNIALYDGAWAEWGARSSRIVTA